jgi:CTP synthase (UTP-ammonia lyase)
MDVFVSQRLEGQCGCAGDSGSCKGPALPTQMLSIQATSNTCVISDQVICLSGEGEEQGMSCLLRVGVIGDFNPQLRYHLATNEALSHAAHTLSLRVDTTWLPTESLDNADCEATLKRYDALWCAPASPYKSMHGALNAIQWAREKDWPFIGT